MVDSNDEEQMPDWQQAFIIAAMLHLYGEAVVHEEGR